MDRFPANEIISLVGAAPRYDLAESVGPDVMLNELLVEPGLAEAPLGYGTAQGDRPLRQRIAELYGVHADDVVLTVGGVHALFLLAFILCGRGGEAVITTPYFPPMRDCLKAVDATIWTLPVAFERGYQPDVAHLASLLSPRTQLVSLASPQNPSGVAIPPRTMCEILAAMAKLCPQAYLLIDETYREAAYGDDPIAASALALGPRVVSVASLSKCHGTPGLRIGWAITRDKALRQQLVLGKFNTVISCSTVDETLALRVLDARDRILAKRRRWLADGLARTAAWVSQNHTLVEWVRPDAGALCCVRLRPAAFDDAGVERFYTALPAENVRVASGIWFGEARRVFRLGFGLLPSAELEAGFAALTTSLRKAASAEFAAIA